MSDQKYYVKLKEEVWPYNSTFGQILYLSKDQLFEDSDNKRAFTKTELAGIMDGALYEQEVSGDILTPDHVFYGSGKEIVSEWINPLIELVPVEEEV